MRPTEITEDLKAIPDDLRAASRDADHKLRRAEAEHPQLTWALDLRVVLTSAALALAISLVARWAGLAFPLALLVFLVLFGGVWAGITRLASPRRPTRPL